MKNAFWEGEAIQKKYEFYSILKMMTKKMMTLRYHLHTFDEGVNFQQNAQMKSWSQKLLKV